MTDNIKKIPIWFWIVSIILLIWNLMGIMNFMQQANMSQEAFDALDETQKALQENRPTWVLVAFGLAVFGGLGGCIALLLKKKIAMSLFLVSLLGVAFQFGHGFATESDMMLTPSVMVITGLVIILAFFSIWLSNYSTKKGWLN
ncbi:MAG: hypothetical protein ACI8SE_000087 [Bacteroidia bacterium]|jgi:hypothetical protein